MSDVVFDTSVVIALADLQLGEWGTLVPVISAATIAELASALEPRDVLERERRRQRLVAIRSSYRVLPFGAEEAQSYGLLCAIVAERRTVKRPSGLHLQIAATAMTLGMPLLTLRPEDFEGIENAVDVVVA